MIKFQTDLDDFMKGIIRVKGVVTVASEMGMEKAMGVFMDDCLNEVPMVLKRTGRLRASHSIFVNGRLVDTSQVGSMKGTPLTVYPGTWRGDVVEGILIANTPYAIYAHEGYNQWGSFKKYTTEGTGPKWIESKLIKHMYKYYGIIGNAIRRAK